MEANTIVPCNVELYGPYWGLISPAEPKKSCCIISNNFDNIWAMFWTYQVHSQALFAMSLLLPVKKGSKTFIKNHPRLNEQKNIKCNKRDHICPLGHMMAKLAIDTISSFPCPNYLKVKSTFLRNIWILRPFQVHVLTSLGHVLVVLNITYLSVHLLLYSSINMEFLTIHFN